MPAATALVGHGRPLPTETHSTGLDMRILNNYLA